MQNCELFIWGKYQHIVHSEKVRSRYFKILKKYSPLVVDYPEHRISSSPMKSERFCDCNGVVLFGSKSVVLSHYDLKSGNPPYYLQNILNEMQEEEKDLTAIIIGGHSKHFEINKKELGGKNIKIVTSFLDSWEKNKEYRKDVVVIPEEREVILCVKDHLSNATYIDLNPKNQII